MWKAPPKGDRERRWCLLRFKILISRARTEPLSIMTLRVRQQHKKCNLECHETHNTAHIHLQHCGRKKGHTRRVRELAGFVCLHSGLQVRSVSVGRSRLLLHIARVLLLLGMCRLNDCCWRCRVGSGPATGCASCGAGAQNLLWIMSKQTIECASLCGATQLSHDFTAAACRWTRLFPCKFFQQKKRTKEQPRTQLAPILYIFSLPRSFPSSKNFLCPQMMHF